MSKESTEFQDKMIQDISQMNVISYLEGSIATLQSLQKAYKIFGEVEVIPLSLVHTSINNLLKDQEERLKGMKQVHAETRANS